MVSRRSTILSVDGLAGATLQERGLRTKRVWLAVAAVIVILGLAWFDGGEEAVHPISQEVAVPELAE